MKRLLLLPLLAVAAAADDAALVTKYYPCAPQIVDCGNVVKTSSVSSSGDLWDDWKTFYGSFGVEWPEGASIQYIPYLRNLVVRNTEENHARFLKAFESLSRPPVLFRTQIHYCAFTPEAFEALDLSETVGTTLGPAEWKALRKRIAATEGAEILGCPAIVAAQDSQGTVKAVEEFIYPTEFAVKAVDPAAGTNAPARCAAAVEPQSFQTREVGQIFQVTPRGTPELGRISLDIMPALVLRPTWRNYGPPVSGGAAGGTEAKLEQPIFPAVAVVTSLDLRPGDTVALGGEALDEPGAGRRFHVFFVTASIVDIPAPTEHPATP